tara:strand:+ start:7165 stop:7836 length:672 start_codon:yes stop_codon:yes gene_type:complete
MHDINLIHYTKLVERLPVIKEEFKNSIFQIKVISEFDKEDLTKKNLKKFDTDYMSLGEISCFMKHMHVYKKLITSTKDFSIVIEDDILLEDNFDNKLARLLEKLPKDFDFVFFGSSKLNMHIPIFKRRLFKNFYKKTNVPTDWGGNGMTKTTDSYIVSKAGAKKIIDRAEKIDILDDALDFWLNQSARELDLNGYWYEPTFTKYNKKFESNLATQYKDVPSKN